MTKIAVEKLNSMTGHRDSVYALEEHEEASKFFSAAGDGMVVLWDLENPDHGQLIARVPNSVYAISRDDASQLLMVGHNYEGVHIIDYQQKKEVGNLKCTQGSIFAMTIIRGILFAGDSTGKLFIVNYSEKRILREIKLSEQSIRDIRYSEPENTIAVAASDNSVYLLDAESLEVRQVLAGHTNSVFTLKFDPHNRYLISAGRDAHIKIWDIHNNYRLTEDIIGHMYTINNIEFSPDGKHFVTCSMDKSIKVWDATTFKLLKVIDKSRHAGHGTSVNRMLWKSYNQTLLSASDDRTISSWQLEFF